MKLQNLVIIFLIIIIPLMLIFSIYLNLETKTISLQTDYDGKLIEATKEALEAFEINTTEWNNEYSSLANAKRQDLMSSINVFTSTLADKLRIGGTSKETILSYVPAIVFIMYDGYYIYSPTYVPQTVTNNNGVQLFYYEASGTETSRIVMSSIQNIGGTKVAGKPMYYLDSDIAGAVATGTYEGISFTTNVEYAKKTYKHVLKTFVPYTEKYGNYTINYTLDNYIRIYGTDVSKEGQIIDNFYNAGTYRIIVPVNDISGIKFDGQIIEPEILSENIPVRDSDYSTAEIGTYAYVYNSNNDKRYYDGTGFFMVNDDYVRQDLPNTTVGTSIAEYKKLLVRNNLSNANYIELYQLLNGTDDTWYFKDATGNYIPYDYQPSEIEKNMDCSAINYYVEAYEFNNWLISIASSLSLEGNNIQELIDNKNQSIINNINENLNLSISNYSANSVIDYKLPKLTDEDWEQALSNISIISFFQGKNIGLKTYNNYVVVTSTQNNEYVSEESLYYMDNNDIYYHRYGCSSANENIGASGVYRNVEFKIKNYTYRVTDSNDFSGYYYRHAKINPGGTNYCIQDCFDCIVNRNNFVEDDTNYKKFYYTALARERYIQAQRTRLIK